MFHKDQFKKELVEDIKNRWLVEVEDVNEEMLRTSLARIPSRASTPMSA